jgi:hypothetical protein
MGARVEVETLAGGAPGRLRRLFGPALAIVFIAGGASAAGSPGEPMRLAYLDPGSGSFILQALVAMLAGAIVAINAYWTRIKRFLGLSKASEDESKPTGAETRD